MADESKTPTRPVLSWLALVFLVFAPLPVLYLHLSVAGVVDPIRQTISEYVLAPHAEPLFVLSVVSLIVASVLIIVDLLLLGLRATSPPIILLTLWCCGLTVLVLFQTDPIGAGLSVSGIIHRYAALVMAVSLPVATIGIAKALRPRIRRSGRLLSRLAVISLVMLGALLVAHIPVVIPDPAVTAFYGDVVVSGLIERLLLSVDVVILALVSVIGLRLRWVSHHPREPRQISPSSVVEEIKAGRYAAVPKTG